ncbi:MAG: PQQ-like beta-propeller repeat protein [Verrucomicrobia bacterium]|nr:PQQ-like beta-propeller repeat protein [Verrucomicrobiota bacterium]
MTARPCHRRLVLHLVVLLASLPVRAEDWPQWLGPQRDGVWRETGILEKFPEGGPKLRWRAPLGNGYSGPAVAKGRVYVMDRVPSTERRSAPGGGGKQRGALLGSERVLCFNEADGRLIWKHEYDCPYDVAYPSGPRVTPTVHEGKVYTLGTEGNLLCLDAGTGKVLWSFDYKKELGVSSPTWGFSANPLIDGKKIIVIARGQGSTAMAFDKDTGKEIWRALSAREPGYCPPVIFEAGGKRQLIIWHPEAVNSLDPETGKVYWIEPFQIRSGLTVPTPRKMGDKLFVTAFYNGPMMFKLDADKPAATVLWRGNTASERNTDKLHSIIATPFLKDGHIYGVDSYGEFRCLKADTGERLWETYAATGGKSDRWATTFIVKHGSRFFLPNEKGDLIIARLTPKGYEEISRAHLIEPTNHDARRPVVWSHPAFANRNIYLRNDGEMRCYSLAADENKSVPAARN